MRLRLFDCVVRVRHRYYDEEGGPPHVPQLPLTVTGPVGKRPRSRSLAERPPSASSAHRSHSLAPRLHYSAAPQRDTPDVGYAMFHEKLRCAPAPRRGRGPEGYVPRSCG